MLLTMLNLRSLKLRAVGVSLLTLLTVTAAASTSAQASSDALPGKLIVGFNAGTDWPTREAAVTAAGGVVRERLANTDAASVKPAVGLTSTDLKKNLAQQPSVAYVEPDYRVKISQVPNDEFFDRLYAHDQTTDVDIDSTDAWDTRTNCSKIAVIDTGVQIDHPDLINNLWHNPKEVPNNNKDDDKNGFVDDYYGVNIRSGKGSAIDDNGHGTHVAGIAAAVGNNNIGVTGVCWTAKIMPVKFLGETGEGGVSAAITAMNYAIDNGAKVINCSFGTEDPSQALEDVIAYAKKRKVLVVVAAGNETANNDQVPSYPASFPDSNIITVAATNDADQLSSFSNFGAKSVDLAAPGEGIGSTYIGSEYVIEDGTSMSTPFVAAAAAMLKAQRPKATPRQIRKAILRSVDKVPALNGVVASGGRLNVAAALKAIKKIK